MDSDRFELELKVTCASVPTQIEGVYNDEQVYFRERYGHWKFYISNQDPFTFPPTASGTCAEFMSVDKAMDLVKALIAVHGN